MACLSAVEALFKLERLPSPLICIPMEKPPLAIISQIGALAETPR